MSDNIIQVNKDLIHTELKNLVKKSSYRKCSIPVRMLAQGAEHIIYCCIWMCRRVLI